MRFYAGIGSRQTPDDVLALMTRIADYLWHKGFTLRSGGAKGADTAFEKGCAGRAEIYLPWRGFENRHFGIVCGGDERLRVMAARCHPRWRSLAEAARRLHTRNVAQVLGEFPGDTRVSEFVVCWTPDAKGGGGTGQAIRIAKAFKIPVYDLADPAVRKRMEDRL